MTLANQWNGLLDEVINQCKTLDGLKDTQENNGFDANTATQSTGTLRAVQFVGLPNQNYIDFFDLNINVAAGNVRIKVFTESQDKPDLFLGESDSLPVTKTGVHNFRLRKQVEVPIDGQLWVAFENDNASLDIDVTTSQPSGKLYTVTHTFGDGPDPWSGGNAGTVPFWAQLHYNPKVVKHYGVRGTGTEDFYTIVHPGEMTIVSSSGRGTNNIFLIFADVSYRGVDFQNAATKILSKTSEIYDLMHMTNLNGLAHLVQVEIFPDDIQEAERLYLASARVQLRIEKLIFQS